MTKKQIMSKAGEWLKRYLPAEIVSIIGAMAGGMLIQYFFHNPLLTALGGTWGENVGYYGQVFYADLKKRKAKDKKITLLGILKILRNMVVEFGPGELLDSLVVRPATMYFFTQTTHSVPLGLFLGKLSADVTFYLPTILAYEFRKKVFKD